MNFPVKVNLEVNYFFIFIVCSFMSCDAKNWLCPVNSSNKSVHEYICRTTNETTDNILEVIKCHLISDDFNLTSNNNSEVTELKFKHCGPNTIESCLKSYENVISLDISDSRYYKLLDSLHLNHENLKKLNASTNKNKKIPQNLFANIPEVIEVDFSQNFLFQIEDSTFESANKLTTIHLSQNKIRYIGDETFAHLKDLEYVDLSHNQLVGFIDLSFSNNSKLKVMHFEGNKVTHNFPYFPFARSVYATWNTLRRIEIDKNGSNQIYRFVSNKTVEGYFRTSSIYTELHCNEGSFQDLYEFHAGPNQIENIHDLLQCFNSSSSIHVFELSRNFIGSTNLTTFSQFANLQQLILAETGLKSFDFADLGHVPLTRLDISKNDLKILGNPQHLSTFKNLREFFIDDNDLKNIPELIDSLSKVISELSLSGNFVGDISQIKLKKFRHLKEIKLRNTSLQLGDGDPFDRNTHLKRLDISYNNLAGWNYTNMAPTLESLIGFSAAGCQIEDPAEVIKILGPNLQTVNLSNNTLTKFKTSIFQSGVLIDVNLTQMSMEKFEMDAVVPLFIIRLDISYNYLNELKFTKWFDIRILNVSENNLTELINFDRSKIPYLKSLNIAGNNFSCEYLVQLLERIKIEWPELKLNGDPYKQKHGEDCRPKIPK